VSFLAAGTFFSTRVAVPVAAATSAAVKLARTIPKNETTLIPGVTIGL
jgi:hypothetical protein